MDLIISKGSLTRESLDGKVAVITGAGGGIGYEAARALIWLGARVIIAEIQEQLGKEAEKNLTKEFGKGTVLFVPTDVGDEASVRNLASQAKRWAGKVDIVINNATVAPLGAVTDVAIDTWDASYRVNLRGPVLMAQTFLPEMTKRGEGVFICVTSKGAGYMGAYETFKAGQEHLAVTLEDELKDKGVHIFTIGPGFSPTETADGAIPHLAEMMGVLEAELRKSIAPQLISIEAAGAGFAAATALAERFHGMEIASLQALHAAGIDLESPVSTLGKSDFDDYDLGKIRALSSLSRGVLADQSAGWKQRSIFEQQWMSRSFKKYAGTTVEEWLDRLEKIENLAAQGQGQAIRALNIPLGDLVAYYEFMAKTAEGYVKNMEQREVQVKIVRGWQREIEELDKLINHQESK
jgi:NAD(P)-dependent dehydrogenase (short-subunit alcohol dehydrogenase family)